MSQLQPEILAETQSWIVVSKPAHWLTIPGRSADPVLNQWVEKHLGTPVWVVHRIDRETSGLVLFARTQEAHRLACGWFQEHRVKKAYDFLATGVPTLPVFRINTPIEASPSVTQVEVKKRFFGAFLGRATPVTGRRHQIRIHLAERKHPLLGDVQYRGPREMVSGDFRMEISRVALHAAKLELPSGEVFEAPWPEDFQGWVKRLEDRPKESAS